MGIQSKTVLKKFSSAPLNSGADSCSLPTHVLHTGSRQYQHNPPLPLIPVPRLRWGVVSALLVQDNQLFKHGEIDTRAVFLKQEIRFHSRAAQKQISQNTADTATRAPQDTIRTRDVGRIISSADAAESLSWVNGFRLLLHGSQEQANTKWLSEAKEKGRRKRNIKNKKLTRILERVSRSSLLKNYFSKLNSHYLWNIWCQMQMFRYLTVIIQF